MEQGARAEKRKLLGNSNDGNAAADRGQAYTPVAFFLRKASTTSRLNFGFSHFVMFVTYLVSVLVGVLQFGRCVTV